MGRAEVHAALGDERRLAIVDALALGDLTPGRLAQVVDAPSNLVAHHLAVLEDAGVVERRRSEADARSTFVTLRLDNPLVAATTDTTLLAPPQRVLFVCSHNSARSQMAASAFAEVAHLPAASAGTEPAARINPLAAQAMARHGLAPLAATPTHVSDVLRQGDLVISVCDSARRDLERAGGAPALHWSIPDPASRRSAREFDGAMTEVLARATSLARHITKGQDR